MATTTITVNGNYTSLIAGFTYNSLWELGNIYYRRTDSNGGIKTVEGLLMLKDINITFANTGYFKTTITPKYSTAIQSDFEFTGKITGLPSAQLEQIPVTDGTFRIPVISKNEDVKIEIKNDSYLPSDFLSYEWLGDFVQHGT